VRLAYGSWKPADVAALAPLALRAAEVGDAVACRIVEEAAAELGLAASAVIRGLRMTHDLFDVVTGGGLWAGSTLLRTSFESRVRATAPGASVIEPRDEAVIGAVNLAREAAGTLLPAVQT
jgi:N-acetylglucosamine kinase-like BadF-type ATPase